MVSPADTALFTLPLELRQLIYKAVVASPLHGPELLQTCREIYLEAYEYLFARPLQFKGQVALFNWLDKVPHKFLSKTKELSIRIQDVDLKSLLSVSALVHHPRGPPALLTWDLYEIELEKLCNALKQLPQVKKITVQAIAGRQSFLYREFLRKFLTILTSVYPDLLEIKLEGNFHHQDLVFLLSFQKLQAFSFDGFSSSSPIETARIFSGLEHLASLSIVTQAIMLTPDMHTHSSFTTKRQSLTEEVVSTMDRLKSLSVTEIIPTSAPSLFFTPEVLSSLCSHQGLSTFHVCLSQTPDSETMAALEDFLGTTQLRVLSLDWPQLDPNMLETYSLIPDCLEKLWVRARRAADASAIIWSIAESRDAGGFHALTELVILRSTHFFENVTPPINDRKDSVAGSFSYDLDSMNPRFDDTDAMNIIRAKSRLEAIGTRVFWCTEEP